MVAGENKTERKPKEKMGGPDLDGGVKCNRDGGVQREMERE